MRGIILVVIAAAGCGGPSSPLRDRPRAERAPPPPPAERSLELPTLDTAATVEISSLLFVRCDRDGAKLGAIPDAARGDRGLDRSALPSGEAVPRDKLGTVIRTRLRDLAPRPEPRPERKSTKPRRRAPEARGMFLHPTTSDDVADAIEQARAAGILGPEMIESSCGDPLQSHSGELPDHATGCSIDATNATANRYAVVVIADRELPAATAIAPLIGDDGVWLARFAVFAKDHVRALPIELGRSTVTFGDRSLPRPDLVIELGSEPLPATLPSRGDLWIWVKPSASYGALVALISRLATAGASSITLTLIDPR